MFCSPLGIVLKKNPLEFRLIQHLSFPRGSSINDFIPRYFSSVSYATITDTILSLKRAGRGCFMAKTDIKSSFSNYSGTTKRSPFGRYERLSGDCPSYMSQMLLRNADISERPSRHRLLNLVCPRFKRESEGGRSFIVSTTRLWNMIPSNIRNKPSLASFKKTMFDHFKDSYKHLDRFIF